MQIETGQKTIKKLTKGYKLYAGNLKVRSEIEVSKYATQVDIKGIPILTLVTL